MDAISDPLVPEVVIKSSAQVGKTLLIKSIIGYYVDQDPSTMLIVQPTLEMAETFSKDRLAPMVRDMECLRAKIADPKSRDSGNTILHKRFPGGHLTIVGANAAASLASRPIRVALFDEVDRYPASSGTEGNPISLGTARTKTYWNRKIVKVSTPGDEETSQIEPAWLASDQRHYMVRCPHCQHAQRLEWAAVKWTDGDSDTACIACVGCGSTWSEADRLAALACGEWVAEFPDRRIAGFHLNELYSPFRRIAEIVADFLASKDSPEKLKTWVNTSLGEVWRDQQGDKADADQLRNRREPYLDAPESVLLVTLAIDVQDDRLELEFVGWGVGSESWGLDHVVLRGDPGSGELWKRADDQLARRFARADGAMLAVAACGIDSAGHYTKQVYEWAKKHRGRVHAMVGRAGKGRAIVTTSKSPIKQHGIRLYIVGVDTAKELILFSHVQTKPGNPGACHWPDSYPDDYFDQLTAESRVVKYSHGQPTHAWKLPKGKRNEALDLRVYGLALVSILRPNFEALAGRISAPPRPAPAPQQAKPGAWVNRNTGWMRR